MKNQELVRYPQIEGFLGSTIRQLFTRIIKQFVAATRPFASKKN